MSSSFQRYLFGPYPLRPNAATADWRPSNGARKTSVSATPVAECTPLVTSCERRKMQELYSPNAPEYNGFLLTSTPLYANLVISCQPPVVVVVRNWRTWRSWRYTTYFGCPPTVTEPIIRAP